MPVVIDYFVYGIVYRNHVDWFTDPFVWDEVPHIGW